MERSSKIIRETEKALQDLVLEPMNASHNSAASAGYLLHSMEASSSSSLPVQHPVSSSVNMVMPSPSVQAVMPTVSAVPSQAEVPLKLKFGLFSGPSLIPSPVPTIQTGSIQMPLHLHPQVGPSLTQMHASQAPFFQFGDVCKEVNVLPVRESGENEALTSQSRAESSNPCKEKTKSESGFQVEAQGHHHDMAVKMIYVSLDNNREPQGQLQAQPAMPQFISRGRPLSRSKAPGPISGSKGKKFIYAVRNSGSRSSYPAPEAPRADSSGFQRRPQRNVRQTEFRVWNNANGGQTEDIDSSNYSGLNEKSNFNGRVSGIAARSGAKKDAVMNKLSKQIVESENLNSASISSSIIGSERGLEKEAPTKRLTSLFNISHSREGNLKRNNILEEDVDVPLQRGVVRVFKQSGIEARSDDYDFIEVRSKRQMLNDRREQREKEIKAKPRVIKSVVTDGWCLPNAEISSGFSTTIALKPLPPIGTPAVNTDACPDIKSRAIKSLLVTSGGRTNLGMTNNVVQENVQTSLGSCGNARINQKVMAQTQTQLDEAMKSARFDTNVAPIGNPTATVFEPKKSSSSLLTQDKSFSSAASPSGILRVGSVISPTILPPSSHAVMSGIGAPGSRRLEVLISHNLTAAESNCTSFFEKEKHLDESCIHLGDPEAEVKAAASAVAVAAISSDEIVGNGLGACSVSASVTKSFGGAVIDGLPSGGGVAGDQQLVSQSSAEESLTVVLPADLSVEMSLLSGGPIFAFGESSNAHSQSLKSSASSSGPLGPGNNANLVSTHSMVHQQDVLAPSSLPLEESQGVQGPPHMVVYNHFAPVGQFRQVGLSFMGTTYIPSGKQPDWKHNPTFSTVGISEDDFSNLNMVSAQYNPLNMPAPIQHIAPANVLLFILLDRTCYLQSSADIPVQACWSHISSSPLHSVPLMMPPLQQQAGILQSQFSHGLSMDQSSTGNRFPEPRSSTPSDSGGNFPVATGATSTQLPDELGLVHSSSPTSNPASFSSIYGDSKAVDVVIKGSSRITIANDGEYSVHNNSSSSSSNSNDSSQSMTSAFKTSSSHSLKQTSSIQQYLHPTRYNTDQRGGVSQKSKERQVTECPGELRASSMKLQERMEAQRAAKAVARPSSPCSYSSSQLGNK
ncbi:hypothetical protein HHK36_002578 [Tetracentron sinense]|uniref:Uncharacterized protein n=1 Tax=Tetracentron sinense TaxID=13715 RepID=A0A835DNG2_TETSI|nr:hypothetical protein HHK36_002578 [Tetracentron sinense]